MILMRLKRLLFTLLCVLACAAVCDACPTCKQAMADGPNHEQVVRGYFWSIIFMMSMPFLIFTGLGLYFYSLVRGARAAAAQSEFVVIGPSKVD